MTRLGATLALVALLAAVSNVASAPLLSPQEERALAEARASARRLAEELRTLLLSEIERGGFEAAVAVCSEKAQARTAQIRTASGHEVRRVSLRTRNPENTPDPWERAGLEAMERLPAAERGDAERVEVVKEGGARTLRFMKPVLTASVCLACHGEPGSIPTSVQEVLKSRYPEDRATGFSEGDVRGAVSVRVPLPAE